MDMDFGADDFKVPHNGKRKSYEVDYESLSQVAVERLMGEELEYVCNVCGIDVSLSPFLDLLSDPIVSCRTPQRTCSCGI